MKKRRYYLMLFCIIFVIVFVCTILVTAFSYRRSRDLFLLELDSRNRQFLQISCERIDNMLATSQGLTNQMLQNEELRQFFRQENRSYISLLNVVDDMKKNFITFTDNRFSVVFRKLGGDIVLKPGQISRVSDFFEEIGYTSQQLHMINEFAEKERDFGQQRYVLSHNLLEEDILTIVKRDRINRDPNVLIYATFTSDELLPDVGEADAFLILAPDGSVLSAKGNRDVPELQAALADAHWQGDAVRQAETGTFRAYAMQSEQCPWQLVYLTDIRSSNRSMLQAQLGTLLLFVGMLLVGLWLARIVAGRLYQPVNRMVAQLAESGEMVGRDEFRYVGETTRRIKKANEALIKALNRNAASLKEKFIKDLIYGLTKEAELNSGLERFGLLWMKEPLALAILEVVNYDELHKSYTRDALASLWDGAALAMEEILSTCGEVVQIDYKRYAAVMKGDDPSCRGMLNQIASDLEDNLGMQLAVGVKETESVERVHEAYKDILQMLDNTFAFTRSRVIFYEDRKNMKYQSYYYSIDTEKSIISAALHGDSDGLMAVLSEVLKENLSKRQLSGDALSQFLYALITTIGRILQQLDQTVESMYGKGNILYLEFKMCTGNKELEQKLIAAFTTILCYVNSSNQRIDNTLSGQMAQYVQEHYAEDISLADMAERFNLSASYISTLFKDYMGENFKDYLNLYRVKKAKEIIAQGTVLIKDLAEMVGCNNTSTFIRIFKRYEGVSPGKYIADRTSGE